MKERLKQLAALIMTGVLVMTLPPVMRITKAATINVETTITADSSEAYTIVTSGNLKVESPATVSGAVSLEGTNATLTVGAGATVSGAVTVSQDNAVIVNHGTISSTVDLSSCANSSVTMGDGAHIDTLMMGDNTLTVSGTTSFDSLDIQNLKPEKASLAGQINAGTLYYNTEQAYLDYVNFVVSEQLYLTGTGTVSPDILFQIKNMETAITNRDGALGVKVACGDAVYTLPGTVFTGKSLSDIYTFGITAGDGDLGSDRYGDTPVEQTVVIKNTGFDTVVLTPVFEGTFFTHSFEAQDGDAISGETITLPAGEIVNLKLCAKEELEPDTYTGAFRITAATVDGVALTTQIQEPVSYSVERIAGTGELQVADSYYGASYAPVLQSATQDIASAQIQYKGAEEADTAYQDTKPVEPGTYMVRAVLPQTEIYQPLTLTDTFTISYLPAPDTAYAVSGTKGENAYYTSAVTIQAPDGYLISNTLGSGYTTALSFDATKPAGNVYLKQKTTGAMTAAIAVPEILIDRTKPSYTGTQGVTDGATYYGESCEITIQDANLASVTVNNKAFSVDANGKATILLTADDSVTAYTILAQDKAGNTLKLNITVAESWRKSGTVSKGKKKLYKNQGYQLSDGTWKVSGDSTSYRGNNGFYVDADGEYTFSQGE